jgi:hypothetical protein
MHLAIILLMLGFCTSGAKLVFAQTSGVRPLLVLSKQDYRLALPHEVTFMDGPSNIVEFLQALEGQPPDWVKVYGNGRQHDERLFELNRQRDEARKGRPALQHSIAFPWFGQLSGYDPSLKGFRLAIGPLIIPTSWGLVRFKPDDLPASMVAVPSPSLGDILRRRRAAGQSVDVTIVMTGRLVEEESLIYDFSHDDPGRGMILPVVHIERLDYFLLE